MRVLRYLALWAVASLLAGSVLFLTTGWASRFEDPEIRCLDSAAVSFPHGVEPSGTRDTYSWGLETTAERQRLPPGVRCTERVTQVTEGDPRDLGKTGTWELRANTGDWLILVGLSLAAGLVLAGVAVFLRWIARRLGYWTWPPPRNPFVWIDQSGRQLPPDELYEKLKPFKDRVAEDIKDG